MATLLAAIFLFNVGAAAWSAVVAGRVAQDGEGSIFLGALYAACELVRLSAAILLPALTLRWGPRHLTRAGLLALVALPLLGLAGLDPRRTGLTLVPTAAPPMRCTSACRRS